MNVLLKTANNIAMWFVDDVNELLSSTRKKTFGESPGSVAWNKVSAPSVIIKVIINLKALGC